MIYVIYRCRQGSFHHLDTSPNPLPSQFYNFFQTIPNPAENQYEKLPRFKLYTVCVYDAVISQSVIV